MGFNIKDIACRKAESDIVVYKVVLDATKDSCISAFENYLYNISIQPRIKLKVSLPLMLIHRGYHSYTCVNYTKDNTVSLKFSNSVFIPFRDTLEYYLAKFIIPKGSLYYKNMLDTIVSNYIRYTGEYYKIKNYE